MKPSYHIKSRTALWAMMGIIYFTVAPAIAGEPGWWTQQKRDCNLPSGLAYNNWDGTCNNSSGGTSSAPGYDYGAAERAQREQAAAEAERQRQAEADRIERERKAEEKRQKDAAFIRDRDAAAGSLKGSSGGAMNQLKGLSGTDNFGLKGSGFDSGNSGLKGLRGSSPVVDHRSEPSSRAGANQQDKAKTQEKPATSKPLLSGDPMVVDARNVPSGLPKGLDSAIATAYSSAPPGVSDRVRKGFQAVMNKDWKVAKAWFQDALNRDPGNVGLKHLVALTDYPPQENQPKAVSPPTADPNLQLPDPEDINFLFPQLQAVKDSEAPVYKKLPEGRTLQMPQESDMEFLFGDLMMEPASSATARKPSPTYIIDKDNRLIQAPENSVQEVQTYMIGKDGELLLLPLASDDFFMSPDNRPATTPK